MWRSISVRDTRMACDIGLYVPVFPVVLHSVVISSYLIVHASYSPRPVLPVPRLVPLVAYSNPPNQSQP